MKKAISATIEESLVRWVSEQLKDKTRYRNKSHLIEIALELLKNEEEKRR
jgi:Arc/MetJ-type ribon-helix-helix transcriptional regulator|tara:strand:+ start:748 stop:897 length:150 start_codon:yes stop_codon:yes gene_type:complete